MPTDNLGYDAQQTLIPANVAGNMSFLQNLEFVNYHKPTDCTTYKCGNLKILRKGNRVLLKGSPATFLNGDNSKSLNFREMRHALEAMSHEIGVNLFRSYVWRNEFAGTFEVNEAPASYFPLLHLTRRGREEISNSLYLQDKRRTCVLHAYPKSENRIRLEVRRRKIAKVLGRPYPVYAGDLCDEEVFNRFALDWQMQVANALSQCEALPELPETLARKSLAQLESQLCRANPDTRRELLKIVEGYNSAGTIDANLRAPLLRELHSPCSDEENSKVAELRSKISALLEVNGMDSTGLRESKPYNHSSNQGMS
jgi:hypothetical protein